MQVNSKAIIFSFIKYCSKPSAPESDQSPIRLACFHHYDEIWVATCEGSVDEVMSVFSTPAPDCAISCKRSLAFMLEDEKTPSFEFGTMGPVVEVALLRVNRRAEVGSIHAEEQVVQFLNRASGGVSWLVTHTLAEKELLILLSHPNSLATCEAVVDELRHLALSVGSPARAFDLCVGWPCIRLNEQETSYQMSSIPNLDKEVTHIKGLRVVGCCQKDRGSVHQCTNDLKIEVSQRVSLHHGQADDSGGAPLYASGCDIDRQLGWYGTTSDLLNDISTFRSNCPGSCCAIYLIRDPDVFKSDGALLDEDVLLREDNTAWSAESISLEHLKQTDGCKTIGEALERIRGDIRAAIPNPRICPEFADLAPMLEKINLIATIFKKLRDPDYSQPYTEQQRQRRTMAWRRSARLLAMFLDRAIEERGRLDLCGQSHHLESAPFGASGLSRLTSARNNLVERTLCAFGLPWHGLTVNGLASGYVSEPYLGLLNCPMEATLQPYWVFGLGHEVGHLVWEFIVWGHSPIGENDPFTPVAKQIPDLWSLSSDSDKRELAHLGESFCDAICLKYTFGEDIGEYLQAWANFALDWLEDKSEHDLSETIDSGDDDENVRGGAEPRGMWLLANSFCQRLIITAMFYLMSSSSHADATDVVLAKKAAELLRDKTAPLMLRKRHMVAQPQFQQAVQKHVAAAERMGDAPKGGEGQSGVDLLREELRLAKRIKQIIDALPQCFDSIPNLEAQVSAVKKLKDGCVLDDPPDLPIAVFRQLDKDASFKAAVAAVLSLAD